MGKRSSRESKQRHTQKFRVRNILLNYSFHDPQRDETVYTPQYAEVVKEKLREAFGYTQELAEHGEVLIGPCGESPTLTRIVEA